MAHRTIIRGTTPEVAPESCPHCARGYILEEVETTLGEFEECSYFCPACCGTGRKMNKAERKAYREAIKAGRR